MPDETVPDGRGLPTSDGHTCTVLASKGHRVSTDVMYFYEGGDSTYHVLDSESNGSVAQMQTSILERFSLWPKRFLQAVTLGILSAQLGASINHSTESLHSISILKS